MKLNHVTDFQKKVRDELSLSLSSSPFSLFRTGLPPTNWGRTSELNLKNHIKF